jgi:ABC-type transport system involved in multi-copper enzyme maturation permease subunit
LLRAEWTKLRSVRSTRWTLSALVVTAIGLTALFTEVLMAHWGSTSLADRQGFLANRTGFLGTALTFAQIPICVLGVIAITSEYTAGTIRSSALAVPRRTTMLAAKAFVVACTVFAVGELVAFPSFVIGRAVIAPHIAVSLSTPGALRAVVGVGLYLAVLSLIGLGIGALIRHTGAAITVMVGLVIAVSNLAELLPGRLGADIGAYLPANAGKAIMAARDGVLSPWQGYAVACGWAALLLAAGGVALRRRDV